MDGDEIHIADLAVEATVGVPDAERQNPQRLVLLMTLIPINDFRDLDDELQRTVDYAAVAAEAATFVRARPWKLIETVADRLAAHLLGQFPLREVQLEVRKFILPDTRYVSVRVTRTADRLQPEV